MPATRHLVLFVPGLAGPVSDHPVSAYFQARPQALDCLLSRSSCTDTGLAEPDAVLMQCFGMADTGELPVAGLTGLADLDDGAPGCLLRADPVHLRADQSSLRLFDAHSFELSQPEADALAVSINSFCSEHGWQLEAPVPQRWYLRLPAPPALSTCTPFQAAGRNIDPYLPTGPDARRWRVIMNELQMLLHDHPVNTARMRRGLPPVNSLWFWGGGALSPAGRGRPALVYATQPLAVGLARHAAVPQHALPGHAETVLGHVNGGPVLVVLDALQWPACYNDVEQWLAELETLERSWFAPLLEAVSGGALGALSILPCSGREFRTGRWRQRAFWRPVRPFEDRLQA